MNEVLNNIITRRSTRAFKNEPLKKEDLEQILQAGIYAPSGMNRQTWQFSITQNHEKIQHLARNIANVLNRGDNYNFYEPAAIILVSNDRDNTNGLADCACALENIFLMANSLGIGSCWINQLKGICDEPEIRSILNDFNIPENHIVWGIAALGKPRDVVPEKEKNRNVIHWIDDEN